MTNRKSQAQKLKDISAVLKAKFTNLSVQETIDLAVDILMAVEPPDES